MVQLGIIRLCADGVVMERWWKEVREWFDSLHHQETVWLLGIDSVIFAQASHEQEK